MIYRENIPVTDYQEVTVAGAVISAAACRSGRSDVIDIWYENYLHAARQVGIYIYGTGHPTGWCYWSRPNWNFINTVVTPSGLIWHVYTGPLRGEAIPV